MKRVAISIGDPNGVGLEIALRSHEQISTLAHPIYCVDASLVEQASKLLDLKADLRLCELDLVHTISPASLCAKAGRYSYASFAKAVELCESGKADAITTLPIHKEAWSLAGVAYKGHTDALRDHFKQDAIMMLGCEELFVTLFTEHIPLSEVASRIKSDDLERFLLTLAGEIKTHKIAVLALNPHAGDGGVLGSEEEQIREAIACANAKLGRDLYDGVIVPDIAFTPAMRERYTYFVAMYHDQGLAPLKALYFEQSINISLALPIVRTSVDHGTAFDIAYKGVASTASYINAIKMAVELAK